MLRLCACKHCMMLLMSRAEIGNVRDQVTNLERELYRRNQVTCYAKLLVMLVCMFCCFYFDIY